MIIPFDDYKEDIQIIEPKWKQLADKALLAVFVALSTSIWGFVIGRVLGQIFS